MDFKLSDFCSGYDLLGIVVVYWIVLYIIDVLSCISLGFLQYRNMALYTVLEMCMVHPYYYRLHSLLFRIVFWAVLPCKIIWQYIPEDNSEHHTRRRENLKSHIHSLLFINSSRCSHPHCMHTASISHFRNEKKFV
jgi:hypothetical protein